MQRATIEYGKNKIMKIPRVKGRKIFVDKSRVNDGKRIGEEEAKNRLRERISTLTPQAEWVF